MKRIISIVLIITILLSMDLNVFGAPYIPLPRSLDLDAYRPTGYSHTYILGYDNGGTLGYQYKIIYATSPVIFDHNNGAPHPGGRLYATGNTRMLNYRENYDGTTINVGMDNYQYVAGNELVHMGMFANGTWVDVPPMDYIGGSLVQTSTDFRILSATNNVMYGTEVFYSTAPQPQYNSSIVYLLPNDGYADNANIMSFLINYKFDLPANYDKTKLKVEITGGVAGTGEVISFESKTVSNRMDAIMKFTRQLYPGENIITYTLKYDGVYVNSKSIKVTYFDDFIDADSDGLDDRTGQTEVPEYIAPLPDAPDGSILGYARWAFENITYLFDGLIGLFEGLFSMTGSMAKIMSDFVPFVPPYVNQLIILSVLVVIILKIFGR